MKELWKKAVEHRGYLEKSIPEINTPAVVPQPNNSVDEKLQKVGTNIKSTHGKPDEAKGCLCQCACPALLL